MKTQPFNSCARPQQSSFASIKGYTCRSSAFSEISREATLGCVDGLNLHTVQKKACWLPYIICIRLTMG